MFANYSAPSHRSRSWYYPPLSVCSRSVSHRPSLRGHGAPAIRWARVLSAPQPDEQHPAHHLRVPAVGLLPPALQPAGQRIPRLDTIHRRTAEVHRRGQLQVSLNGGGLSDSGVVCVCFFFIGRYLVALLVWANRLSVCFIGSADVRGSSLVLLVIGRVGSSAG